MRSITIFISYLLLEIFSSTDASKIYEEINSNFLENDLMTWSAPETIRSNFTYYFCGYDDEGTAVWVSEWGRWNVRAFIEEGGEALKNLDKYIDQLALNYLASINASLTDNAADTNKIIAIVDLEGYNYEQLSSGPTLRYYLKKFTAFSKIMAKYAKHWFVINTNFFAEAGINLMRPVLGEAMTRAEIYGTNKAKWQPLLLQKVQKNLLPEWYGGSKNFAPSKVYG